MYCPSCGTEVTKEMNYCNRCGASLSLAADIVEQPVRVVSRSGPFWAMALMVVIGLGIIFSGMSNLTRQGLHPAALTWLGIFSFMTLLSAVKIFMRHLSNTSGQPQTERLSKRKKEEKEAARPAQLPPTRMEPVPSVTENTTRTFEPIERRR